VLISNAYAQAAPAGGEPGFIGFLPIIIMFVLLYFLMIRPQMKRAKEQRTMIDKLAKGDEVITGGGLAGRITGIGEVFLTLEIADQVEIKVQKQSVTAVLPKGTLKAQ
jgi:preprotein translocase subunit YajC